MFLARVVISASPAKPLIPCQPGKLFGVSWVGELADGRRYIMYSAQRVSLSWHWQCFFAAQPVLAQLVLGSCLLFPDACSQLAI